MGVLREIWSCGAVVLGVCRFGGGGERERDVEGCNKYPVGGLYFLENITRAPSSPLLRGGALERAPGRATCPRPLAVCSRR